MKDFDELRTRLQDAVPMRDAEDQLKIVLAEYDRLTLEVSQERERSIDHCAGLDRRIAELEIALEEIRNLAEGRADVDQKGDPPAMVPNDWMQVQVICDAAMK